MTLLAETVRTNLIHYNQWTGVSEYKIETENGIVSVLQGTPSVVLPSSDTLGPEWVVPILMLTKTTSGSQIELWFKAIAQKTSIRPKRLTMAMVNDDGTVVYYFVHDGVVKPRQN